MPPQYLIIGLSHLTEPLLPAYVVKLEHYGFTWTSCITEVFYICLNETATLDYTYFAGAVTPEYAEYVAERLQEDEDNGKLKNEYWTIYQEVVDSFVALGWIYYKNLFNTIQQQLGNYKHLFQTVSVIDFLEATHDVVLEFEWEAPEPYDGKVYYGTRG